MGEYLYRTIARVYFGPRVPCDGIGKRRSYNVRKRPEGRCGMNTAYLEINNGRLSSRLIRNRHSGATYRGSDMLDTPCGLILKVCCVNYAQASPDAIATTIPWSMRGSYDALLPDGKDGVPC